MVKKDLKKMMSDRTPLPAASSKKPATVKPAALYATSNGVKPNGANGNLKVPKMRGVKEGVVRTQRYSFEITPDLKEQLEAAIVEYRKATGKDMSKSHVIRTALGQYLKKGKLK